MLVSWSGGIECTGLSMTSSLVLISMVERGGAVIAETIHGHISFCTLASDPSGWPVYPLCAIRSFTGSIHIHPFI